MIQDLASQVTNFVDERPAELVQARLNLETRSVTRMFSGNIQRTIILEGIELRIRCDHLVAHAPGLLSGVGAETEPEPERGTGSAGGRIDFWFHAGGNVLIEIPSQGTSLEAESFYYDHTLPLAVFRDARVRTTVRGFERIIGTVDDPNFVNLLEPWRLWDEPEVPLFFRARSLRTRDFRTFDGVELRLSTCDFADPHFALATRSATVTALVTDGASGGSAPPDDGPGSPADPGGNLGLGALDHLEAVFDDARLELWGTKVLPLPVDRWDSRWSDFLPVRRVGAGSSSKFGARASVEWNLNFFLGRLPLEGVPALQKLVDRSKLSFGTEYMRERGFAFGPSGEYGRRPSRWRPWQLREDGWDYYGEARYFGLRDHGEDRFAAAGAPPDPDRHWTSFLHRQSLPRLGTLDVEYSRQSDANVLGEYFESIEKQEKEQESLVSLRRNFGDNMAATGLFKYRSNDFDTTVERLPEARLWLYQEPVFDSGLYTDFIAQAANLRVRPDDGSGLPSTRFARADVLNEWSYPLDGLAPVVQIRPYAFARFAAYEEVADPSSGSENRFASGAGVVASQQWSRVFPTTHDGFLRESLGLESLAHIVVPSVSYENVFTNDLPSSDLVQVDEVDEVDLREAVGVSLAQTFISRYRWRREGAEPRRVRPLRGLRDMDLEESSFRSWRVLDSDLRFVVFPRRGRDNDGDSLSLLVLDNTLRAHQRVSLRSWVGLDPDDRFGGRLIHNSVRTEVVPDLFALTVGNTYAKSATDAGDSNFILTMLSLYPGERWRGQVFWQVDVDRGRDADIGVTIGRVFHRFALLFEYSFDAGEDDNQTLSVNFRPLDFLGGDVFTRGSRW